jgi:TRAP-type C4-dicarboxylate transport system permease small subunit
MIRRILDGLYLFAGYFAGLFLVFIFCLMMSLSVGRDLGIYIPAGDDFAAWSMAAMAFLGLAYTFKSGELIRVGLVVDRIRGRARRVIEILCLAFGTAVIGYFAWYALHMAYDSWRFNDMSQGVVAVPLWFPQLGYSVGLAILAIAFADELVRVLSGRPPSYERPPPATPEEIVDRAAESGI